MDGKYDQAAGNVKKTVGDTLGNERLQAEGKTQNATGNVSEIASTVEGYVQGFTNQVKGAVTGTINSLTGNHTGEAESTVQQKTGEAQKKWNS